MTALAERLRPSTSVKDWVNPAATAYVRPADWVALPVVNVGDQKFVGLHAVYDHDSNFVAVNCAGAYTVDWGDGTAAENIASGVQANHNYVYSALGSGTLSSRGYRQAVVTITPQAGSNLTTVNLLVKHSQSGLVASTSGWLDIRMAGSLITTLTIGASATTTAVHRLLEQFEFVGSNGITACRFSNCTALKAVVSIYTGSVASFGSMFSGCVSLQSVPLLNTAAGNTFSSMFQNCSSLQSVPLFNTAAGTSFATMFSGCSSLRSVPVFNTASGTAFDTMFSGCVSLQSVPLLNTAAGTNFTSMFAGCTSLQSVPLLNTASGLDFTSMFSGCTSLQSVPLFNTAAGTTFTSMFASCSALETVPALNTAAGVIFTSMFSGCPAIRSAPLAGTKVSISYSSCSLGPTALDAIYTALAAGVTGQTITVTSNWGTTSDTPSIATAKGWTVTGS